MFVSVHVGTGARVTAVVAAIIFAVLQATPVECRPEGAPASACSTLTPQHPGSSQTSPIPYSIDLSPFDDGLGNFSYIPGLAYDCK